MQQYDVTVYADFGPIGTPGFTYRVSAASLDEASGAALAQAQERNPSVRHFTTTAPEPVDDDDQQPEEVEEEEEEEEEEGANYPTLTIDGQRIGWDALQEEPDELARVQVEFLATSNGEQSDADERAALGWCNNAAIELDRADDAVHVSISVGDPRGAFVFTVRRLPNGQLLMYFPTPEDGALHMPLALVSHGVYRIGHSAD